MTRDNVVVPTGTVDKCVGDDGGNPVRVVENNIEVTNEES